MIALGNCDIGAEQKDFGHEWDKAVWNLVENKRLGSKNLSSFVTELAKGLNEIWFKFCPFGMDKSEQSEAKHIIAPI